MQTTLCVSGSAVATVLLLLVGFMVVAIQMKTRGNNVSSNLVTSTSITIGGPTSTLVSRIALNIVYGSITVENNYRPSNDTTVAISRSLAELLGTRRK